MHGVSVSLCSKGTPRGSSASGESVTGTGIDGHPEYADSAHLIVKLNLDGAWMLVSALAGM